MSDEYIESGDAARLSGVELRRVQSLVEHGIVIPAVRGTGRGDRRRHKYDTWNIFALCVARDLRQRGFGIQQVAAVMQKLNSYTPAEFNELWKVGRVFLVAVGIHTMPLLSHAELFTNPYLPLSEAFGLNLPIAVIDTRLGFQNVSDRMAAIQSESKREAAVCPT